MITVATVALTRHGIPPVICHCHQNHCHLSHHGHSYHIQTTKAKMTTATLHHYGYNCHHHGIVRSHQTPRLLSPSQPPTRPSSLNPRPIMTVATASTSIMAAICPCRHGCQSRSITAVIIAVTTTAITSTAALTLVSVTKATIHRHGHSCPSPWSGLLDIQPPIARPREPSPRGHCHHDFPHHGH